MTAWIERGQSGAREVLARITWVAVLSIAGLTAHAENTLTAVEPESLPDAPALLTLENETSALDERTGTPMLINVWATWCLPCLEELPALNRLSDRLGPDELHMIALNYGDSLADVRAFLEDTPIDFEVLLDATAQYAGQLPMKGLPTTFLVDPRGRILYRLEGIADWGSDAMVADIRDRLDGMDTH